ncbi:MAG TPA: alpha/beta hydrolase [Pseudonocardiaceae bacterium]
MPGADAVADDGCRLWTVAAGHGVPLVLCHGGPGLWDMFGDLAGLLADRARAVRWDQRGCGRSELRGPYSVARSVADLDAVRRHHGYDRVAVLGHSWGAHLALRYALAHPDRVDALVYVSGTGLGRDWKAPYRRAREAVLGPAGEHPRDGETERDRAVRQWTADFADPATAAGHAERMATPWFPINHVCHHAMAAEEVTWREADLVAACRSLTVQTLVVDGAADLRPRSAVDSLCAALPSVTRVVVEGAGHLPWVERPDLFRAAVLAHLTR